MTNIETYFPNRYITKRPFASKLNVFFCNSDFDNDIDSFHELREFIREPVDEWHKGAYLPDEIFNERDDILARLHKDTYELPENPTEEESKRWVEQEKHLIESKEWKEWSNWISKTQDLIIVYRKLEQEAKIAKDYIRFCQNGRIIYEISPSVKELIAKAEVGNVKFKNFILPRKTVYLHFGTLDGYEYPVDYYEEKFDVRLADSYDFETFEEDENYYNNKKFLLEGAFVSIVRENAIDIQLCFRDPKDDFSKTISIVDDHRFPSIEFSLDFGYFDRDERKIIYSEETTFNQSTVVFSDIWDEKAVVGELNYEELNTLTTQPEKCYDSEWKEYILIDKSLKLIVNSIRYLSPSERDIKDFDTNQFSSKIVRI